MSRAKYWCFTLNNYSDENIDKLAALEDAASPVSYVCYGKEVGESGTPHLQGFVAFKESKRLSQVVSAIGQAHLSVARKVPEAIAYCKKDGDFTEIGTPPPRSQGGRSDLEALKFAVKEKAVTSIREMRWKHSEVYAKYPNFCMQLLSDIHEDSLKAMEAHPLRVWQASLLRKLRLTPNQREITFVVDLVGNTGKSWFAQYCEAIFPSNHVQIHQPGKKDNMAYFLNQGIGIFFLDAPRSKNGEFIQYDFLEHLKDGRIFSPKYESKMKRLNPVHVVVMMNEEPNMDALSADRYDILRLNEASLQQEAGDSDRDSTSVENVENGNDNDSYVAM